MIWEIINLPTQPKCILCEYAITTTQMARFVDRFNQYKYICSNCARFVKDAMNKWEELKDVNYIDDGSVFDHKNIKRLTPADRDGK